MNERIEHVKGILDKHHHCMNVITDVLIREKFCDDLILDTFPPWIIHQEYEKGKVSMIDLEDKEIEKLTMEFIKEYHASRPDADKKPILVVEEETKHDWLVDLPHRVFSEKDFDPPSDLKLYVEVFKDILESMKLRLGVLKCLGSVDKSNLPDVSKSINDASISFLKGKIENTIHKHLSRD